MVRKEPDWGTRLADVRVPSWYGFGVFVLIAAQLIRDRLDKREWMNAEAALRASALLAERTVDGDKRDVRVAELTERMESYGKMGVRLASASLCVAVAALAVAVTGVFAA